jgi:DNA-binding response OmpR family regulator
MSEVEHRPTILMVGQGEPMQTALGEALRRHRVSVAGCATAELEQAVRVYAPDLVVLIGDAAVRGGASVVRRMAGNRATDVLPVAVISNDAALEHEGHEFRSGAVAIVARGSGADAISRRLVELSEEIPERAGMLSGELSQDNLQDVVDLVSNDTKTGILSIRSPKGVLEGMPLVVETERASAHNMELILDRLRDALGDAEPLQYEFHETSGGRLSTLPGAIEADEVDLSDLEGARVVILDSNELRAEKLAQVLMQRGVQIAAADFSTAVIPRIREIDPQVVVLDSSAVGGHGIDFVRAMRKDPQLRWSSMLVVRWEDFWPSSATEAGPDLAQLASRICPLIDQDLELARRVEDEVDFDTRLELVGPGRLLRALGSMPGVRHVAVAGPKRNVEIDIADNSIVGAYATLQENGTHTLQGMPALLGLWGLNSGRVSVREQDLPSVANIMMPVDEALGVVSHQLGFADGSNSSIEVNAETIPPVEPAVDEHATVPPGAEAPDQLDDARTMSPPRFRHLRQAVGAAGPGGFSEEEVPTNKVQRLLGRLEPKRRTVPVARGAEEEGGARGHTDHGVHRKSKSTQLGLAPVFEALPDELLDEQKTLPVPGKPPPPPPESRKPTPPPMFEAEDEFQPELARVLEGATMVAPAPESRGTPAWLQVLLLVTLIVGVGVAGWLLWSRSGSAPTAQPYPEDALRAVEEEHRKGPITGSVNGLGAEEPSKPGEDAKVEPEPEAEALDEAAAQEATSVEAEPEPEPEPEPRRAERAEPKAEPARAAKRAKDEPVVPTQNLPRDPAKASDVLVHRSLPLIRKGKLASAEATLDRAWELDPRNPQAMAGYARLYIAKRDADNAVKWAKKAVRKRSRRAPYHVLLGDALLLQGDEAGARKAWRKALSVDPNNRTAKARLSQPRQQAAN